jgi:hypothetical protein
MLEPRLLLRDRRKLVFSHAQPRRSLNDLRASDIIAGGNEGSLAGAADRDEIGRDSGIDFSYFDDDGRRVAVEFKVASGPTAKLARDSLGQLRSYAAAFPAAFDRVELWVFDRKTSTLLVWSQGDGNAEQTYGLTNVLSMERPLLANQSRRGSFDSEYVESRVRLWQAQVQQLYAQISDWCTNANYSVDSNSTVEMNEELMRRFAVRPTHLPILKIARRGGERSLP